MSDVLDHIAQRGTPGDRQQRSIFEKRFQIDRGGGADVLLAFLQIMAAGRDNDMPDAEPILDSLGQLDSERGDIVDSNLDDAGGNGGLQQTGYRWPGNVHFLGDLFLRAAFQIIKFGDLDQQVAFFVQRLRHRITS